MKNVNKYFVLLLVGFLSFLGGVKADDFDFEEISINIGDTIPLIADGDYNDLRCSASFSVLSMSHSGGYYKVSYSSYGTSDSETMTCTWSGKKYATGQANVPGQKVFSFNLQKLEEAPPEGTIKEDFRAWYTLSQHSRTLNFTTNFQINKINSFTHTSGGEGELEIIGCDVGGRSCSVRATESVLSGALENQSTEHRFDVKYTATNGNEITATIYVTVERFSGARAYSGGVSCSYSGDWTYKEWTRNEDGRTFHFYQANSSSAKLPECFSKNSIGIPHEFKGWVSGLTSNDITPTLGSCGTTIPAGSTVTAGENYSPCFEAAKSVTVVIVDASISGLGTTWKIGGDGMSFTHASNNATVELPEVSLGNYSDGHSFQGWVNSQGIMKQPGEPVELNGDVWTAVINRTVVQNNLYKNINKGDNGFLVADGMTGCSVGASSQYVSATYTNGDCMVVGNDATPSGVYGEVVVSFEDGSERIYKFTVIDMTGESQNGNEVFVVDTSKNIEVGENDDATINGIDTQMCTTFELTSSPANSKVFADYKVGGTEAAKSTVYLVEPLCDYDDNEYIALCLDPGRRGPGERNTNGVRTYVKVSDVSGQDEFGRLIAYLAKNYKIDGPGSENRVIANIATRIYAIKNGISSAIDSSDKVYYSHFRSYEAVANKLKTYSGEVTPSQAEAALDAGFSNWRSDYSHAKQEVINIIVYMSKPVGEGGSGNDAAEGFERTVDSPVVNMTGTNSYTITYTGTITLASGAYIDSSAGDGLLCPGNTSLNKYGIDGCSSQISSLANAADSRSMISYTVSFNVDTTKLKIPTTKDEEKELSFRLKYSGGSIAENIFIAQAESSTDVLQRMLIFNTSSPDLLIYFKPYTNNCDLPILDPANCTGPDNCDLPTFNAELFKASECCKDILDETSYLYMNVCSAKCTTSTMQSICRYNASNIGQADIYEVKEGSEYNGSATGEGSGYQNAIGTCVVNVTETYRNDGGGAVNFSSPGSQANFVKYDDNKNVINVDAYNDNRYCQVTCKEDWDFTMDSFGNYVGENAVAAGTYFQIINNDMFIGGKRTCYTTYIDYDHFMENLVGLSEKIIDNYKKFSEHSHIWTDYNKQTDSSKVSFEATVATNDSEAKKDPQDSDAVCVQFENNCSNNTFWSDSAKECVQLKSGNGSCPSADWDQTLIGYDSTPNNGSGGSMSDENIQCKYQEYKCTSGTLVNNGGRTCRSTTSPTSVTGTAPNLVYNCPTGYDYSSYYGTCVKYDSSKVTTDGTSKKTIDKSDSSKVTQGELKCIYYGKTFDYELDTNQNIKVGNDKYWKGEKQSNGTELIAKENGDASYEGTAKFECELTAANYYPDAHGSSVQGKVQCKTVGVSNADVEYGDLEDYPDPICKTGFVTTSEGENFCKSKSTGNKQDSFDKMKTDIKKKAEEVMDDYKVVLISLYDEVYDHAKDMFDCQHFQLHNSTDDNAEETRQNNEIQSQEILGMTRDYVKIITMFDPAISYTYDGDAFMTILGEDNIMEMYDEKNDAAYGGAEGSYFNNSNAEQKVMVKSNGEDKEMYLYRNKLEAHYYKTNGIWQAERDKQKIRDYEDSEEADVEADKSKKKVSFCVVGKTTGDPKSTSMHKPFVSGDVYEWKGGICYAAEVHYVEAHYVKSSIANSSFYKNKGYWYARSSDVKEHGDDLSNALENGNKRNGVNYRVNDRDERRRWSIMGSYNVFPISMDTPRNLYQYTYTFGSVGSFKDGTLGRIMGSSTAIIQLNKRTCFYEVFEEVCLCCGEEVTIHYDGEDEDLTDDFLGSQNAYKPEGSDKTPGSGNKVILNTDGTLSFATSTSSLGNLTSFESGRQVASNWRENTPFMYNGNNKLTTDKGQELKEEIEVKGETVYADTPEYAYYLTPSTLTAIREYNDEFGYDVNYNNLKVYGRYSIAPIQDGGTCTSPESCSWTTSEERMDNEIMNFQHYGSTFLEGFMNDYKAGYDTNLSSYDMDANTCFVKSDFNQGEIEDVVRNNRCRWVDYIDTTNTYIDPTTGKTIKLFRLAFK